MTSINITQLTAKSTNGSEVLSIDSPEVIKALGAACQGEAKAHQLWFKAANTIHRAGVTYMQLAKDTLHKPTWDKLQSIVINSQSANDIVLFNAKTIELNQLIHTTQCECVSSCGKSLMSTSSMRILDQGSTIPAPVDYEGILKMEGASGLHGASTFKF